MLALPELRDFLAREFPQVAGDLRLEALSEDAITVRLVVSDRDLRPGGTVGGPAMFMLADVAAYCLILSRIGLEPLAVTTGAGLDFLRKPGADRDVLCEARLLKLGRSLAVVEAHLRSEGLGEVVARANLTYFLPRE